MSAKLDILFLNLHRRYLNLDINFGGFLGIYYLSAFLRRNFYEAKGFSGSLIQGKKILDDFCSDKKISMLGLYCDYDNVTENIFISRYVKENFDLPVIVGGPQATALEENFFVQSKCDAVVIGEGELTVLELAKFFIDGFGSLSKISGIVYQNEFGCVKNPARPLIKNLDELPFINDHCYLEPQNFYRELNIMTGRGCPFHCSFCHEGIGKGVRLRSVENILAEIDEFLNVWTDDELKIYFTDDTFTLSFERVKKICEGIAERRKNHNIKFFCEGHVHTLYKNHEMIRCLAESGCYRLQLGIESGNDEVLKAYGKNTTTAEILEVVKLCIKFGIKEIYGNIILGGAFFSDKTFETDKKFVRELLHAGKGVVEIGVVTYYPLPQTKMTTCSADFGLKICDSEFLTSVGDFPQIETAEIDKLKISEMRLEFEHFIEGTMIEILRRKLISTEEILSWFREPSKNFGHSAWFLILKEQELMFAYYEMLYLGEAFESNSIENLETAHPLRISLLYRYLKRLDKNSVLVCDEKFINKELEILTLTTGKLSVSEIAERISIPVSVVITVLNRLKKKFLIVYTKF